MTQFRYVEEYEEFLTLFPHRGSYLYADHPQPGQRPEWRCENRHLLSDRLIKQGAYLYGVRFGSETNYLLLDIDRRSVYHPYRDPFAIQRIVDALEPIGLNHFVAISSSYSGGFHLYFPFILAQASWAIAQAAESLLKNAGLKVDRGHLELFPNARHCGGMEYNGHRLPLQSGSYLLDGDWQPCFTSRERFCVLWRFALGRNDCTREAIDRALKKSDRRPYRRLKYSAQKFLNDLNAEIESGWSGFGQTNQILGRIALRAYVFHHVMYGGEPLKGHALAEIIADTAETLPGYQQWCRHKHELISLSLYWARAVELSNYYPYGKDAIKVKPSNSPSWNERQAAMARGRIVSAIKELRDSGRYPDGAKARHLALKQFSIGSDTLYRNKELWHPDHELEPASNQRIQPRSRKSDDRECLEPASNQRIQPTPDNKLGIAGSVAPPVQTEPDPPDGGSGGVSTGSTPQINGVEFVKAALQKIRDSKRLRPLVESAAPPPDEAWFQLHLGLTREPQYHD